MSIDNMPKYDWIKEEDKINLRDIRVWILISMIGLLILFLYKNYPQ